MTEPDLTNYQSTETAWRYDSRMARLKERIDAMKINLAQAQEELAELEAKPPLRHLFNWSA